MASFTLSRHEIMGFYLRVTQAEAARITGGVRASTAPSLQFGPALEGESGAPDPQQPQQLTRMLTAGMTVREKVVEVVGRANAKVQLLKCTMHGGACVRITALPVLVISHL